MSFNFLLMSFDFLLIPSDVLLIPIDVLLRLECFQNQSILRSLMIRLGGDYSSRVHIIVHMPLRGSFESRFSGAKCESAWRIEGAG